MALMTELELNLDTLSEETPLLVPLSSKVSQVKKNDSTAIIEKIEWFNSENFQHIVRTVQALASARSGPLLKDGNVASDKKTEEPVHGLFWNLRHYALASDVKNCQCIVQYKLARHDIEAQRFGRIYAYTQSLHSTSIKHMGLQNMPRWIRSALASDFYWDLDISNAHPSLLLGILESKNIKDPKYLRMLVNHRDQLLTEIQHAFELEEKKQAKELLTRIFYGGQLDYWCAINQKQLKRDFLDGKFDMFGFSKEMHGLSQLLWTERTFSKLNDSTDAMKDYCAHKYPNNSKKQLRCFLSLFLQSEELTLLEMIECFMVASGREMDVYIHDGGLIRKRVLAEEVMEDTTNNSSPSGWINFDPAQFKIEEYPNFVWEAGFPPNLLRECESFLTAKHMKYRHIRLLIKSFDKDWTKHLALLVERTKKEMSIEFLPIPRFNLRRTYEEILYLYEKHYKLCYLERDTEYFFGGEFFPEEKLKQRFPIKLYYQQHEILPTGNRGKSLSSVSHTDTSQSPFRGDSMDRQIISNGEVNAKVNGGKLFFYRYLLDEERATAEGIIFCDEELDNSGLKKPSKSMISKAVNRLSYLRMFTGVKSFEIMQSDSRCYLPSDTEIMNLKRKIGVLRKESPEKENHFGGTPNLPNTEKEDMINYDDFDSLAIDLQYAVKKVNPTKDQLFDLSSIQLKENSPISTDDFELALPCLNHFWLLCKEEKDFEYLVKWAANIIQNPTKMNSKKGSTGLILFSAEEGAGKSIAAKILIDLLSPFSKETSDCKDVFGSFGTLAENCLLLHIEDADASEMKHFSSQLKNRITAKTITIEKKFKDKETKFNLCRFLITTNILDMFKISEHDRRWHVISCSPRLVQNINYFKRLDSHWSVQSARKALFRFLQKVDLRNFNCEISKPRTLTYKLLLQNSLPYWKRFMMGISLWFLNGETEEGRKPSEVEMITDNKTDDYLIDETAARQREDFIQKYQVKVKSLLQKSKTKTFWMGSKNLFNFYDKWLTTTLLSVGNYQEDHNGRLSLSAFSRLIRGALNQQNNVNDILPTVDTNGFACLPIFIDMWSTEATHFGLEKIVDSIDVTHLASSVTSLNNRGRRSQFLGSTETQQPTQSRDSRNYKRLKK